MSITDVERKNYDTLMRAAKDGNVALVECTDKRTGERVPVLCAMGWDADKQEHLITPFALLFDGTQYEWLEPPT